jgi:hypothetical protein
MQAPSLRVLVAWASFLPWFCHPAAIAAQACQNPIACENLAPGDTGWDIIGSGDASIQGFSTNASVNAGETVSFKVNTDALTYRLDIYRMGYYGGSGARKVATIHPSAPLPQIQPPCLTESSTKLVDCGNWAVSASWEVPSTAVSGIYIARLVRPDTEGASHIVFVVRNDAGRSDILFKTADETWQAYNHYGGSSFEGGDGTWDLSERAFRVSYNRPFSTRAFEKPAWFFGAEYAMVRWLEANGYDVSYFTGIDAASRGHLILNHKVLLAAGQDEYVSGLQRANLTAARDAGVNLALFNGSESFWKTKWDNSIDGTNTPFRTLDCFKETLNEGTPNSVDPLTWTGTWRDPRFSPPSDAGLPENSLTGTLFMVNAPDPNLSIEATAADGRMRFWRNTSVAELQDGQIAVLPAGTLGSKWDIDIDNGFRPAGLVPLSTATYTLTGGLLLDYGATFGAGVATHRMSLYRAPSGALVFSAGTARWPWGLDAQHDGEGFAPDRGMQQATVNLLADMDVQPGTPSEGLVSAVKSDDTTPPASAVASAPTVQYGAKTTITGTAADTGGGVVAAVEVSTDGGRTWHPAVGREDWTYEWTPSAVGSSTTVLTRAVDDSGNVETAPAAISFEVAGGSTALSNLAVSEISLSEDSKPVELGMKFRSDVTGYVTAIRFYKGPKNTGTHIGNFWSSDGTRLASVTFTNETASGWQQAFFPSPVRIAANVTYVISYYAPSGGYAVGLDFFKAELETPPLHALADGADGPNGVYLYAAGGGFPTETFRASNYWVDVVFRASSGPARSVVLNWTISTTPDILGYNVYRATTAGGAYRKLNTSPTPEASFVDNDVVPGQTYFYVTTAVDQTQTESTYSNEAVAFVPPP